jgi:hypothetical protein
MFAFFHAIIQLLTFCLFIARSQKFIIRRVRIPESFSSQHHNNAHSFLITTKGKMAWSTKKSFAILAITIAVLCAVIVSTTMTSRDRENKRSTRSAVGTTGREMLTDPTFMPSDIPSMSPSDTPSMVPSDTPSMSPSDTPSMVPSDYPSSAPSDIPSNIPTNVPSSIPLSDYPSIVPSSWGTIAPTAQIERFATKSDRDHERQVRALRLQQKKARRQQVKP